MSCLFIFFFFSSRRRHTRLTCDWSSDVCSSDLPAARHRGGDEPAVALHPEDRELAGDVPARAGGTGHRGGGAGHVLLEVLVAGPAAILIDGHRRLTPYWP